MIASRRAAHRRVFVGLAGALPLLFGLALLWRSELPPRFEADRALFSRAGFAPKLGSSEGGAAFALSVVQDAAGRGLVIQPSRNLLIPDLLVYWLEAGSIHESDQLPTTGATLVGNLSGTAPRRLRIPDGAVLSGAELAIYSLAHRRVVEVVPIPPALPRLGED